MSSSRQRIAQPPTPDIKVNRRQLEDASLMLFMLPAMLLVTVFVLVPSAWAIIISFTNQSLVGAAAQNPEFVGFANYLRLYNDAQFWNSLRISFIFVFASALLGQFIIGLILAVLLRKATVWTRSIIGGSVLLAWVVPEIVAAYIWVSVFNFNSGSANQLLTSFGFAGVRWLIDTPLLAIILANIWRGTAFSMLLFSSALETISQDVYDASEVDGASGWTQFRYITVPMLRYTIILNLILLTMGTFAVFGLVFALTNGGPTFQSEVVGVYIYRNAFRFREIGYGSAASVIMLIINLLFALVYLRFLNVEDA